MTTTTTTAAKPKAGQGGRVIRWRERLVDSKFIGYDFYMPQRAYSNGGICQVPFPAYSVTMSNRKRALPPESLQLAAERFKVLSDQTRLSILQCLRGGEKTVGEVTVAVGASQPTVSKHLAILAGAGMIARRQDGNRVLCRITDPVVFKLCDLVCGNLGGET